VLRCYLDGWFTLNQQVDGGTLGELLSHTSPGPNGPAFDRLDRLDPVAQTIAGCTKTSFPAAVANLLDSMAMVDAVPGADAATSWQDGSACSRTRARSNGRLATPYSVDSRGRATASSYPDAIPDAGRWSHRIDPRPRTA
jgi:hypothetical protein